MTSSVSRLSFKISVFLSYPKPYTDGQIEFVDRVCAYLDARGFAPRTLGVTDYDIDAPLKAIRRLMLESNGLITIAFRRTHIAIGASHSRTDSGDLKPISVEDKWLTSSWAHIEPAMAYQIGLPILLLREKGIIEDGILEKGVVGTYLPEFSLVGTLDDYFASPEWTGLITRWEGQVRSVVDKKGNPPQLY
jgi:hypothetical protein